MTTPGFNQQIDGVVVVDPASHGDARGSFVETWREEWVPGARRMVQSNRSDKVAGSLIGLHYHLAQADYWYLVTGSARVFLHDLRPSSSTHGATLRLDLEGGHHRGVYIPPGVAHGFSALSDVVLFYLVDAYYDPADELGVAWDDPELGLDWGIARPVLSPRDVSNPRRRDIPPERLPTS